MTLPKPKTILRWVEAEPNTPLRELAARHCIEPDVFKAKLQAGILERNARLRPLIQQAGPVTTFSFDAPVGWSQWFLLQADNHHDSTKCNRGMEAAHLQEAVERGAMVMILGDFLDAMQGKHDKRSNLDELRTEYKKQAYYSAVAEDAAKFLAPYASQIILIADGNHETAIRENSGVDILDMVIKDLALRGADVRHGGYGGWALLRFDLGDGKRITRAIKYHHGFGGEAPVTKGVIQTNRQAVYLADADFVVNGHSHNAYYVPIARERLSDEGRVYFDVQHHIRIPGYKQDYGDGSKGWDVLRGGVPKPIGAAWVLLSRRGDDIHASVQLDICGADPIELEAELFTGKVYAQDPEGS